MLAVVRLSVKILTQEFDRTSLVTGITDEFIVDRRNVGQRDDL